MLRKGTRVEWVQKGERRFGVVAKGGAARVTVVVDGGEFEVSGPAKAFTPSQAPLPNAAEFNPMAAYSIKAYKEIEGHGDSPTFSAKIYKNGRQIAVANNDGWGGSNMYYGTGGGHLLDNPALQQFREDAQAWAEAATGQKEVTEAEDLWIHWEVFERPFGRTAKDSLKWLAELHKTA